MKKLIMLALMLLTIGVFAQAPLPQGAPGPNIPKGKAPEQGYVPDGWPAHPGSLMKYSVEIRFGEEPETMPEGMKFGRVSAVTTDNENNVYVFKRDAKTDQLVVFNSQGKYLRSWGKGMFTRPHGLRVDRDQNVWAIDDAGNQIFKFTRDGKLLQTWGVKDMSGNDAKTFNRPTDIAWDSQGNAYISDGYGNRRVVKLDKAGNYVTTWGTRRGWSGAVPIAAFNRRRFEGPRVCERPREQPHSDLRHRRQAPEDVDTSRMHTGHVHFAQGRDVDHHPSQQHRERHLRHARGTIDEDRCRERQDSRIDGVARPHADDGADGRDLRGQPHRQRVQVADGSVVAGEGARGDRARGTAA